MKANNKDPKLTYALDSSGKMVNIGSVTRGLSCNCRCPKCNEPLVAKLGHEGGRKPHFAHRKDSDCQGSYMTALHKLAEQIIEEEKSVMAPPYKEIEKQKLLFEQVEVEQRVDRKDLQPDLVGVTSDGNRWFIEIRNTHEVDEVKRNKIIESNINCLEINVKEQTLENLKSFLLESAENRKWINNPIYDNKIDEFVRNKVSIIVRHFEEIRELQVNCGDNIHFKDIVVSISDNGQYAAIHANSIKDIPYLFHIGRIDVLEQIKPTKQCNELTIDIDKYPVSDKTLATSYMSRLYLYTPKGSQDTQETHQLKRTSAANLPFERFWIVDDYYKELRSTNIYKTEKGISAKILHLEIVANMILVLYKDPVEVRTSWPYHISILSTRHGDICRNNVADFTNQLSAEKSYYQRLNGMSNGIPSGWYGESKDDFLPF